VHSSIEPVGEVNCSHHQNKSLKFILFFGEAIKANNLCECYIQDIKPLKVSLRPTVLQPYEFDNN